MALNDMTHSFIELCKPLSHDKAVIHEREGHRFSWVLNQSVGEVKYLSEGFEESASKFIPLLQSSIPEEYS